MLKRLYIGFGLLTALMAAPAAAIDGYDHRNHTRITIVAGDRLAVGEDLGVYIWNEQRFVPVEVENIIQRGNDLEIEITDRKTNKYYFFEIASDDPGIDLLPEFDPGLPFPEVLGPEAHLNHDLLELRGNMLERGNHLDTGNMVERENALDTGNQLEGFTGLQNNHHLLYQGFQPSE